MTFVSLHIPPEDAEKLFRHHITLALAFYEAETGNLAASVMNDPVDDIEPINLAIVTFIETLNKIYEEMDQ